MNWKASCSDLLRPGISLPLLRENFRRFWAIPVLAFLFYFLSGPFLILMTYNDLENNWSLVTSLLQNDNVLYAVLYLFCPIIAAVTVFRYLQQSGTVIVTHAMPFSRSCLFNTNFLSGFLMTALPLIGNGILLLLIRKPLTIPEGTGYYYSSMFSTVADTLQANVDVFSYSLIVQWMFSALLVLLFVYTVTVFAGVVTGNSLLHFAFGLWFNFLLPIAWLCLIQYFQQFFYGFSYDGSLADIPKKMSPYTYLLWERSFTLKYVVLYVVVALLLTLLSKFFYGKRAMERAGDALTFSFMQPLLCYLIAFMSMTLSGVYFDALFGTLTAYLVGMAFGGVLGFLVGRMIVKKTLQIFNRSLLKSFGIYVVIAAVVLCSIRFDIAGYQRRVPELESLASVTSASLESNILHTTLPRYSGNYTQPELMNDLVQFHQEIIDHMEEFRNNPGYNGYFYLQYETLKHWTISRRYWIPRKYLSQSPALQSYFERPQRHQLIEEAFATVESMTYVNLYNLTISNFQNVNSSARDTYREYGTITMYPNEYDLRGLLRAVQSDYLNQTLPEALMDAPGLFSLEFIYDYVDPASLKTLGQSYDVQITPQMTETLAWVAENCGFDPLQSIVDATAGVLLMPRNDSHVEGEILEESTHEPLAPGVDLKTIPDISDTDNLPMLEGDWDGDTVYFLDPGSKSTVKRASLSQLSATSSGSLITDPDGISQVLAFCETSGSFGEETYSVVFLWKSANNPLIDRMNYFYVNNQRFRGFV